MAVKQEAVGMAGFMGEEMLQIRLGSLSDE